MRLNYVSSASEALSMSPPDVEADLQPLLGPRAADNGADPSSLRSTSNHEQTSAKTGTVTSELTATAPVSFDSIPSEILPLIFSQLSPIATLYLGSCSRSLRAIATSDTVWRSHLIHHLGFTDRGVDLWIESGGNTFGVAVPASGRFPFWYPQSLLACYHFSVSLHEPLEAQILKEPKAVMCSRHCPCQHEDGRTPHWHGCVDLRLCLELANPFHIPVWTFFAPKRSSSPWPRPDAQGASRCRLALHDSSMLVCIGFAARSQSDRFAESDDSALCEAVLLSLAPFGFACTPQPLPAAMPIGSVAALGWAPLASAADADAAESAVEAVQARQRTCKHFAFLRLVSRVLEACPGLALNCYSYAMRSRRCVGSRRRSLSDRTQHERTVVMQAYFTV